LSREEKRSLPGLKKKERVTLPGGAKPEKKAPKKKSNDYTKTALGTKKRP